MPYKLNTKSPQKAIRKTCSMISKIHLQRKLSLNVPNALFFLHLLNKVLKGYLKSE